jgi:hypothetical protein
MDPKSIDGVLIQWGERLFYPSNRIVNAAPPPRLAGSLMRQRAKEIRARIEATVVRRSPQVMVKVTGGGRGMKAIAAHFKYISKNGRLDVEDDRGEVLRGSDDLNGLLDDWRHGGTPIDDVGYRREAFNIMLSMPRGVDALYVQKAAREFAEAELAGHKYVMVLHDHQANPHVHLSVRAESRTGKRLNPRKVDLRRWRQVFAEKLRGWGVEAEATPVSVRGQGRQSESLWKLKARQAGRMKRTQEHRSRAPRKLGAERMEDWTRLFEALSKSESSDDQRLGVAVARFVASAGREIGGATRSETVSTPNPRGRVVGG